MNIAGEKINVIGDSITCGIGSTGNNVFWKLLEKNDGAVVRGYGISGTRIAPQRAPEPNADCEKYFGSRVDGMDPDADVIVIFGGTNDYEHGDAAFGTLLDRSEDTFCGAFYCLIKKVRQRYPEAKIIVMTPCRRLHENKTYNEKGIRCAGSLSDYVNAIIAVSGSMGVKVVDLYHLCPFIPEDAENRRKYTPDGLHPSDEGNQIIYERLKEMLSSL